MLESVTSNSDAAGPSTVISKLLGIYLLEKLEILANGEEIEIVVEAEDVDAAAGAAGVEDDGVRLAGGGGSEDLGGDLAVGEGVVGGGARGHYVEDEGDEEERDGDDEEDAPVAVDLVGEGGATTCGPLEHLVGSEGVRVLIGRGRGVGLAVDELGGGRRPVPDLTVGVEGLGLGLLALL